MSVIWRKVWRDLWMNKTRTFLAIWSITGGVFAIGVTFGMADQMLSSMDAAHQATFPAHIQMFTSGGLEPEVATRFQKIGGVEDVELDNFNIFRYKVGPEAEWKSGWLVMRDDYEAQKYDVYELNMGQWPVDKSLGIERLSSSYYDLSIGDQVIFEVEEDKEQTFSISGQIRHPFVPPPAFGGPAVFFIDREGLERFGIASGTFNRLLIRVTPYSDSHARDMASEIKDRLSKEGITVASTNYQDPEEHWGRPIMRGIHLVSRLIATVSLAISVVLVINTLTALITEQTNQIGIMKTIGARNSTIVKVYLAGVVVYGLFALSISLPLGALLAFGISRQLLNLFNIDYNVFQVSKQALLLQVLAATLVPVLSALWPVFRGATITVREAISSHGLSDGFGARTLDHLVKRLAPRSLSRPYLISIRNMFRRQGRFMLTQLVLIIAGTMFLLVMSLSASLTRTLDNDFGRRQYDMTIIFKERERIDRAVALAESQAGVAQAEVWYSHSASILKAGQRTREAGFGTEIIGIPAGSQIFRPLIISGRWLDPSDERAVVINIDTAEDNRIQLGETITLDLGVLGDSEWQVVGFFNDPFGGDVASTDPIYANQQAVFRATRRQNNQGKNVYVRTDKDNVAYVERISTQLKEQYDAYNMETKESETLHEVREAAELLKGINRKRWFP